MTAADSPDTISNVTGMCSNCRLVFDHILIFLVYTKFSRNWNIVELFLSHFALVWKEWLNVTYQQWLGKNWLLRGHLSNGLGRSELYIWTEGRCRCWPQIHYLLSCHLAESFWTSLTCSFLIYQTEIPFNKWNNASKRLTVYLLGSRQSANGRKYYWLWSADSPLYFRVIHLDHLSCPLSTNSLFPYCSSFPLIYMTT